MVGTDSAAASGACATANLACLKCLGHRNFVSKKFGTPPAKPYPDRARFKLGNGRPGEVRYAADFSFGLAAACGDFAASLIDADIPALLREGAPQSLGGQLAFYRKNFDFGQIGDRRPVKSGRAGPFCSQSGFPW